MGSLLNLSVDSQYIENAGRSKSRQVDYGAIQVFIVTPDDRHCSKHETRRQ